MEGGRCHPPSRYSLRMLKTRKRADRMTPRQSEVLHLLLQGHKERDVADALGLSVHTVHEHVKQIYKLLGVGSRAMLLAKFIHPPIATRRIKP